VNNTAGKLATMPVNEKDERWFVYILRCADDTLYTGITTDPVRRLRQHNNGSASRYTRSRLPVKMEYQEPKFDHSGALRRELAIKKLSRQKKEVLFRPALGFV
jgi:predicted GIY-YIG superfamily endonuclease